MVPDMESRLEPQPSSPLAPLVGFSPACGARGPGLDCMCRSSIQDEQDAMEASLEEWQAQAGRGKHVKRKQRQEMASRLLSIGEQPGQDFFRLLASKLEEYKVATPTVQIEYRNLCVRTRALASSDGIATAGNFGPRLVKAALGLDRGANQELTVLDGLNGVLKPGRCTLLLGPPGSGKTTFLKVLGNRLRGCSNLQVSGQVLYNGHTKDEFVVERTTAFVDQHDDHIASLSVGETIKFAHTCQRGFREPEFSLSGALNRAKVKSVSGALQQQQVPVAADSTAGQPSGRASSRPGSRTPPPPLSSEAEPDAARTVVLDAVERLITEVWGTGVKSEVVLRLLGLGHCRDTLVGDGGLMLRGISGGERKRLTTAEMVVGPQRVLLMDEISTGLDSATLYSVITFFTAMSHALNLTTIISLLQPPPEVFSLFDDLLLLVGGKMVYHGPLGDALQHFTALGFHCPVRKDVPSFLLEITTPAGQLEFASQRLLHSLDAAPAAAPGSSSSGSMLLTLDQMAASFWSDSAAGSALVQQLAEPFDRTASHPAALERSRYALSPLQAVGVVTRRQMKLVLRDKVLLKGRLMQIIVVSLLVGSLFFRLGHGVSDARSFFGAAFMVVLFMSMGTMPQIGVVMAQKGVWLKHRTSCLYPGYAHGLAMALSQLPVSIVEATLFSCITYFMVGFHPAAAAFFNFWAVVAASNLCLSALFRLLAVLAPNPTLAAANGGLALLVLILTSGFAIVRGSIPPYWIWAYYLSPFAYALRALAINEFSSPEWGAKVLGVPGASTMGKAALVSFDFHTSRDWIGGGIAFLIGAYIVLSALTCLMLDWVTGPQQTARMPDGWQHGTGVRGRRATAPQRPSLSSAVSGASTQQARGGSGKQPAAGSRLSSHVSRAIARFGGGVKAAGPPAAPPSFGGTGSMGGLRLLDTQQSSSSDGSGSCREARSVESGGGATAAATAAAAAVPAAAAVQSGAAAPSFAGWGRQLLGAGRLGGLQLVGSVFRSSDVGEVFSPKMPQGCSPLQQQHQGGGLDFVPITLVFQELRYFVPNPACKRRRWFQSSTPAAGSLVDPGCCVAGLVGGASVVSPAAKQKLAAAEDAAAAYAKQGSGGFIKASHDGGSGGMGLQQRAPVAGHMSSSSSEASSDAEAGSDTSGAGAPGKVRAMLAAKQVAAAAAGDGSNQQPYELELLKGISGFAVPGKLMALMGGSGAGKTTLMDVICGRKTVGRTTGQLLVNGRPLVKAAWARVVGYVEQMDVHTPAQTVSEALWFSGRLRLGPQVLDEQVRAYVEQVMHVVDLTSQAHSLVGAPGGAGGLSTEQRKRLTIAVELVANPSVFFMDEPTSGLDARSAAIVMRAVRNVALSGRTVMVTIHQPSIEIFEAFDTLLLLQRGGRTTYFGPLGHESSSLVSYLTSVPGTCPLAAGQNPASWMLEVTGGSMAVVSPANDTDWPGLYAASSLAASNAAEAQRLVAEGRTCGVVLKMASTYAQPMRMQVRELLSKFWAVYWRTPSYTLARVFLTLCVAFIYGSMYYGAGRLPSPYATMGSVQNVLGVMFSSTNFLGMTNLMAVMPLVGMERVVFYRERGALPYDAFAYGTAIALVDMPYLFAQALLFVPIMYGMIGFVPSAEAFFFYLFMFTATISFYTIFGQFMVYVTPSQQIAQVAGSGLNFVFNIFNGFVIAYPAMPSYWRWLNRLVPTTWVLYGLGASQLGNQSGKLVQFAGRRMTMSAFTHALFGYEYGMRWWCLAIVLGYVLFFRVTSILALRYINFLRR